MAVQIHVNDDSLTCPITLQIFRDPVIAGDGHAYERAAISRWILEYGTSPLTRASLNIDELRADDHLRYLATQRRASCVSFNTHDTSIAVPNLTQTTTSQSNQSPSLLDTENVTTSKNTVCSYPRYIMALIFIILVVSLIAGIVYGLRNHQQSIVGNIQTST